MTAAAISLAPLAGRSRAVLLGAAGLLGALLTIAIIHRLTSGAALFPHGANAWLILHLVSVIPALPLGAYILLRRKGDGRHRLLGRVWALLMLTAALSSFGLHGLTGGLSPIHLLSILVLVSVPRAILSAVRGKIAAHRRTMVIVYASLLVAGFFTMIPGRLIGTWLFG